MGNVMAYSGLTTKIRAMQAKLLTQADYETISGFTDVVQVVEFLKTKPAYAVYMDQLELAHLHRGDIEKMLYQSLYKLHKNLPVCGNRPEEISEDLLEEV